MYKRMKKFVIIIALISIIIVSFFTYILNRYTLKEFKEEYKSIKENQIEFYFNENYKDLEDLIYSHAVWTDTLEAIKIGDFEWLYDNATGYIVDDESLNIDYLFITDESDTYMKSYGEILIENVKLLNIYKRAIKNNEESREIIWNDGEPLILIASPILDNEESNPSGCYVLGRKIGLDELFNLKNLLSSDYVQNLQFSNLPIKDDRLPYNNIASTYVLDENNKVVLNSVFSIKYFTMRYNVSMIVTIIILIVVALSAVIILTLNIKKMSNKLSQVIKKINQISNGEYQVKLNIKKSKMMPEVSEVMESINTMACDIEKHIAKVQENASVIDQQYISMINLLVDTVEMNDNYTYHHSLSVAKYAMMIGKAIGFENLKDLELAAQLHDIGKISIASEILNKPGKLTIEEFEVIKSHSINGYKLLSKIDKFEIIKYGVLYHHEKYNGTGYPEGLVGDEIPMIAQIISVADIYDALTSDRAYRCAINRDDAMAILIKEKGKALNPILVDVFYKEIQKINCVKMTS
jgi:putative nucleotidyltransferase with HDIG domain